MPNDNFLQQAIFAEDINVQGMVKNHNLAQAVNDAAFNSLMLKLASKRNGMCKSSLE